MFARYLNPYVLTKICRRYVTELITEHWFMFERGEEKLSKLQKLAMEVDNGRRNIVIDVLEQVDALSANRDHTKLVAVGCKGLMKIFATEGDSVELLADLRGSRSRKVNLLYSSSHVAWSPVIDNLVATTSTNGAVVLWNIEKVALNHTYKWHSRSATKVCFHHIDANTLLSGAKDASVIQYDLRCAEPAKKFLTGSYDPIRDMQFGVHSDQSEIFVTADEGGSVRFWDLRRNDRPLRQFVAHHGPASVALNPNYDDRNLVATAGRDKFIRVYKWSDWSDGSTNVPIYSVEATTPVARVYWRPQNKYQVASSAVLNDTNIYVWDIRRPFLPFASFDDHRDGCTDMAWKPGVSDSFISAGKDGLIVMHYFRNAHHPLSYVNDVALDLSPSGEIAIALSNQIKLKNESLADTEKRQKGETVARRRRRYDPFQSWVTSYFIRCVPTGLHKTLSSEHFIFFAKNYKLGGADLQSLCEYNSEVAEKIGNHRIAHTWRMVELLCSLSPLFDFCFGKKDSSNHKSAQQSENGEMRLQFSKSCTPMGAVRSVEGDDMFGNLLASCVPPALTANADFFFGDAELNTSGLASDCLDIAIASHFDSSPSLKNEVFQPRPQNDLTMLDDALSVTSEECSSVADENNDEFENDNNGIGVLSVREDANCVPIWEPLPMLQSMFSQYTDIGDVQTCVSVLLALGPKSVKFVDADVQKLWFYDYIDILDRYELWTTSAEVIKRCWISEISELSLQSTFIRLKCAKCGTVSASASPYCAKCTRKFHFPCAVCELPVRGLWAWCHGCRHGGHPEHLSQWFSADRRCPSGCGHLCAPSRKS